MRKDFKDRQIEVVISYGHFLRIWHSALPEFVVGKVSTFTKCSICTSLKEERRMATTNTERTAVQELQDMHIKHVQLSRRHYHDSRERARLNPHLENTIIIDGMDQSKTNLPSLLVEDKSTKPKARLRTHLTGVLLHTNSPGGMESFVFVDILNVPHDSNLNLNVLVQVLLLEDSHGKRGQKLNVQMDNCFRENKNRYILAFGLLLVEFGIYSSVEFNFLPVGHTHEDVDQLFSRIAEKLRHNDVYTLEELHEVVENSYTPRVLVRQLFGSDLWDIKSWLLPHLKPIGNHSKPHHFLFKKVNGAARMYYRMWCCDPWRPNNVEGPDAEIDIPDEEQCEGLSLFKSIPEVTTIPTRVIPSLEKNRP
ncbi:uncharacterized protein LOC119733986 [Patiria miniata]|uniref:DUF7869 domain-containing protein n=1 Tax=Patiria miniata TaxID=46514 RepID=A0A914AI10_PATMI|nr:uncharacterized protein LOC119733986 [Patiria miniata]